ncbi:MAG: DUF445 family protein [bacterium]|nr:MAG: DUF445 family protein [bacterium]
MTLTTYFLIFPLVGALVGWLTNWLAILMLFRPRKPVHLPGWTIQGVIPRRHAQLAERIAETVESRLLTQEDLEKAMSSVHWREEVDRILFRVLHERGPGSIIGRIPGISHAWTNMMLPSLQEVLSKEIMRLIDGYRKTFIQRLRTSVDIRRIVQRKVEEFEVQALENLIRTVASREFVHIQVVGALTGAAIGVIQGIILLVLG